MAFGTRSSVFAFIKEVTEGILLDPTAASFTKAREGTNLLGAVNTEASDELTASIGASKTFVTSQAPTGTVPHYFKHSGTEGTAPDYGILIESSLGAVTEKSTEYSTTAGSTAGTASARGQIAMVDGEAANMAVGEALLLKDLTNGYSVRNIYAIDESGNPDLLDVSFNLANAPASGVGMGKAQFYYPQSNNQPTFSAHHYQDSTTNSALHQAMAGCRTTSMAIEFNAQSLAVCNFEIGGISFYKNPLRIDATNNLVDFTDDGGTVQATLTQKVYATPIALAAEIAAKMTAASIGSGNNTITVTWDYSTGKFTIASDGSTLSLLWNTGAGTATSVGTTIGFDTAADDTLATTYTADNALTYEPPVTPAYDSQTPNVVRYNELLLGNYDDYTCLSGQALSITVDTAKTDIPDWCPESGISESVNLTREVGISGTFKFRKHEVEGTHNLLNNISTSLCFNHGEKDAAGNWIEGTVVNVYCPSVSISSNTVVDQDGYLVVNFEGTANPSGDLEDIYINFL